MAVTELVIKNIITKLLLGEDYGIDVVTLINSDFLKFSMDFFRKIFEAKLQDQNLDLDWYKKNFVDNNLLKPEERAIYAGINKKTIVNMKESGARQVVIDAATENYDQLSEAINALVDDEKEIDLSLTIKFKKLSVDLTLNESLLLINALAVKRSALKGGYYSTAGKRVEKPLLLTLCNLFRVPESNYSLSHDRGIYRNIEVAREIDFYINNGQRTFYKCEVKLSGKGNPESADVTFARDTHLLVADTISTRTKTQLNNARKEWVELRSNEGYKRFETVLMHFDIPHASFNGNLSNELPIIFSRIFEK